MHAEAKVMERGAFMLNGKLLERGACMLIEFHAGSKSHSHVACPTNALTVVDACNSVYSQKDAELADLAKERAAQEHVRPCLRLRLSSHDM